MLNLNIYFFLNDFFFVNSQVNHSPDFSTLLPMDRDVKDALLFDTLVLINLAPFDRCRMIKEEKRKVEERMKQNVRIEERYHHSPTPPFFFCCFFFFPNPTSCEKVSPPPC